MTAFYPDKAQCLQILTRAGTPANVRAHCEAVASLALRLGKKLTAAGCRLDMDKVFAAAMLHDVLKAQEDHAFAGARLVADLGWPDLSRIIAYHMQLPDVIAEKTLHTDAASLAGLRSDSETLEILLVFCADKRILETREITIRERFSYSKERCTTPASRAAWLQRFEQAQAAENVLLALMEH